MTTRIAAAGAAAAGRSDRSRLGRNPDDDRVRCLRRPPADGPRHPAVALARRRPADGRGRDRLVRARGHRGRHPRDRARQGWGCRGDRRRRYLQSAVVGEHLCGVARRKGLAGLIANGAVRDVAALAAWADFPVFALGRTARGPISIERGAVNGNIVCGGVPVRPHDLVLGDDDGVIVIPREEAEDWLVKAREKLALEQQWAKRLSAGESMLKVFGILEA